MLSNVSGVLQTRILPLLSPQLMFTQVPKGCHRFRDLQAIHQVLVSIHPTATSDR